MTKSRAMYSLVLLDVADDATDADALERLRRLIQAAAAHCKLQAIDVRVIPPNTISQADLRELRREQRRAARPTNGRGKGYLLDPRNLGLRDAENRVN